jgi:hypothetical protein
MQQRQRRTLTGKLEKVGRGANEGQDQLGQGRLVGDGLYDPASFAEGLGKV